MMKHLKQLVGTVLMAVAVLILGASVQAATITNAQAVPTNGTRSDFTLGAKESRFYKITTDGSRAYYSITCHNNGSEWLDINLYNGPGTDFSKTVNDSVPKSSNETYTRYLAPNTTYYLEIYSYDGTSGFFYVNKIADDYGNYHAEATPISFGQMVEGSIEVSDLKESDFFKFTTDGANAYYAITAYGTGSRGVDCKMYAGPDESYEQQDLYVSSGTANTMTRRLEKNHTYYIRMMGSWDDATKYKLDVKKIPDDAVDDFNGAKTIKDGKKVNGKIEVRDDVDFYKFKTAKNHTAYKLTLRNKSQSSLKFTLYTRDDIASAKTEVNDLYVYGAEQKVLYLKLSKNHTYYLKVSGGEGSSYDVIMQNSATAIKKDYPKKFKKGSTYYGWACLNWTNNNAKYTGVEIYRSTRRTGGFKKVKTITNDATHYDDKVKGKRTYYYKLCYYVRDNGKIKRGKFTRTIGIYVR